MSTIVTRTSEAAVIVTAVIVVMVKKKTTKIETCSGIATVPINYFL